MGLNKHCRWRSLIWQCLLLLGLFTLLLWFKSQAVLTAISNKSSHSVEFQKPHHLRLVLPASEPNVNICKTAISAAALNYPTPLLINWNETFNDPKLIFGGSHVAKIGGILDYLVSLGRLYEDDLMIVADGYDSWFQLSPQIVVERFYEINRRANQRIRQQFGSRTFQAGVQQRVVFSAQKRCWPKGKNHPACYAVPESILPPQVYGPATDTDVDDEANPFVKYRQRYLNSGFIMGQVKDLRAIFYKAFDKAFQDSNFGSDQSIFAEMFGHQEFQRYVIAHRNRSFLQRWLQDMRARLTGWMAPLDRFNTGKHKIMEHAEGTPYEFGIGLDYEMRLSQPTVFSEYDTEWIIFERERELQQLAAEKNITAPRLVSIADDLAKSTPPFFSLRGKYPSGSLPSELSWKQVPLFANIWTGYVPTVIHHNAHRDGLKNRIITHWNQTWFQPHARTLLEAHVIDPMRPVVSTRIDGIQREWWSFNAEKGGVDTDKGTFVPFSELCSGAWEQIFSDDKGDWQDPR